MRSVLHLDLDSFFVSVERLLNSSLTGKPIIIGGKAGRGVVASCSYEARYFGVHSGMPMRTALNLCSEAILIRGDHELYSKYSKQVTEIISESAPVYEKASIDEHYLDLTGMDKFFGVYKWSKELKNKIISNTGLPISLGLSLNKTVSKIATGESKPLGALFVQNTEVSNFLAPLSIKKIPGLGNKSYLMLRAMGIDTINTLRTIPPEALQSALGKNGLKIRDKAFGIDSTPVIPYQEGKSMGTERTFSEDTDDVELLNKTLSAMVEKLCFELRKKGKMTSCVTIKIRYADFNTYTLQKHIAYTSFDGQLLLITRELFKKLYNRRILVRLIGVRFTGLITGTYQYNLFEDYTKEISLYQSMDSIKKRYGRHILSRASGSD